MKLQDRGTCSNPWIIFSRDHSTGVSILDGGAIWILDSVSVDLTEWLNGLQQKGHIDRMTKYAIIAATVTGDGLIGLMGNSLGEGQPVNLGNPTETTVLEVTNEILSSLAKRFSSGG